MKFYWDSSGKTHAQNLFVSAHVYFLFWVMLARAEFMKKKDILRWIWGENERWRKITKEEKLQILRIAIISNIMPLAGEIETKMVIEVMDMIKMFSTYSQMFFMFFPFLKWIFYKNKSLKNSWGSVQKKECWSIKLLITFRISFFFVYFNLLSFQGF